MTRTAVRSGKPVTVVVVDDDDVNRHGMAGLLACDRIRVAAALSHTQALAWTERWRGVDVTLVDAADDRAGDDHFPGVAVVERIRLHAGPAVTVVIVTGHFFDEAVRRRMREAGADFFYHRSQVGDVRVLRRVVTDPEACRRVPVSDDPDARLRHGITRDTRVNRAVAFALERGLDHELAERSEPRSRRWLRLRRDFNREARLIPRTADGCQPDREQQLPSLPQIARFLTWATKSKLRPGVDPGSNR